MWNDYHINGIYLTVSEFGVRITLESTRVQKSMHNNDGIKSRSKYVESNTKIRYIFITKGILKLYKDH